VKTIVIFTAGTLGDHLPFIALGRALRARGHHVRAVVNPAMARRFASAGLEVVALPDIERGPEHARRNAAVWDHWALVEGRPADIAAPDITFEEYLAQARALIDACAEADLLISTSIRILGFVAHHATGVPWLTVSLNPSIFVSAPADPADQQRVARRGRGIGELAARMAAALGTPAPPPIAAENETLAPTILLPSSRHFSQPDLSAFPPGARVIQTGFWFDDELVEAEWVPDHNLGDFLASSPRPIALSFSSQPHTNPAASLAAHARAAQILGHPMLVQHGWAGFGPEQLPPDVDPALIHFADFLPHDWLFARVDAVIQHGGIGSIARALRQNCPVLLEPFGNDQFFNAARATQLGVGAAMHPHRLTPDGLARVLRQKVLTPAYRERAAALGALLRAEDGLAEACRAVEAAMAPNPAPASRPGIPRIIHQTWKRDQVPGEWRPYQERWRALHPDWEYRLWTDADLHAFIREHYGWFLPIYEGYTDPIMRADAARYFLLFHFGGLYADLDYECLRPFDELLSSHRLVVGLEPAPHMDLPLTRATGLQRLLCNALMASEPGHPFWEHVFRQLVASHKAPEPLGATGPFMLTHAYDTYQRQGELSVLPAEQLHPITGDQRWAAMTPEERAAIARVAYGVHHWHNSWCHEPIVRQFRQLPCTLLEAGRPLLSGKLDLTEQAMAADLPLVSCLLVTRGRPELAMRAVDCYRAQRYPRRELLIVDDDPDETLAAAVAALGDPSIRHLRLPDGGLSLGELRNLAVREAAGAYVAQWDDDDLYDPERLAAQMAAILTLRADVCVLHRHRLWWPEQRRMAFSTRRIWEGSLVAARAAVPPYPALRKHEDGPVLAQIVRDRRVAVIDAPTLYTYVFHGANTHGAEHWEQHWHAATETFEHAAYAGMLAHLLRRHPLDSAEGRAPHAPAVASRRPEELPPVLIATPLRDAARHLPRFVANLRRLSYPHSRIAISFLEDGSADGTYATIEGMLPELRAEFARVELLKADPGCDGDGARTPHGRFPRSRLARSRNQLLERALGAEEWVLWIDADVADWPADVIERLLAADKEIVVPNCIVAPGGRTFDYNSFRLRPDAASLDWSPYVIDGVLQPPVGFGRLYLNELRRYSLVELDAVGGAMLLVRAALHRKGLRFPDEPYKLQIEAAGLALRARELGVTCWGLPNLEIIHSSR
jgi:UDP:flavonoid glycosyltransferase YjiC (YdhE family)/glycosyltransferase involved in cell wall biosynthesis